ncbi:hypothetical protein [Halorussus marinus]|uniref:hypothetical protein n=1 Tax=Halorussus marinus TaxID=2505976 RepID=UPI001092108D|nr:hypothetical protein [Halorussus marinus]
MDRWYLTGPAALGVGWLASTTFGMMWFLPGAFAAMLPVWAYRSRGSRTAEHMARQMAYEMEDSLQTTFGIATGILLAMMLFAQTLFNGTGEMLGVLGNQAAGFPLPIAYWTTSLVGLVGFSSEDISMEVFAGFALMCFAVAYAVKRG